MVVADSPTRAPSPGQSVQTTSQCDGPRLRALASCLAIDATLEAEVQHNVN